MTRAYNTATTQQNSGGAVPAFLAGKNKLINGDFGIWQRGTSVSLTTNAGAFLADRFLINWAGTFTGTMSQQTFTPGTAPVAGYEGQYFLRINRTGTTSVAPTFYQRVEDVRTFAGQTTTFSFWAKADTSRSVSLNYFQSFGSGGSSAVSGSIGTVALTTSWQRFSLTFTLPSVAGKTIGTSSWVTPYFDLPDSTAFTFDTWGHQWEAGSVATPFQTATGTIQGELAACQRYYEQSAPAGTVLVDGMSGTVNGVASAYSASDMRTQRFDFKVTKRVTPTMTYYRSNDGSTAGRWVYYVSGWTTPTGLSNSLLTQDSFAVYMTGSFTTRDCYIIEGGGWSASAEL
jgi:hypothetical protein